MQQSWLSLIPGSVFVLHLNSHLTTFLVEMVLTALTLLCHGSTFFVIFTSFNLWLWPVILTSSTELSEKEWKENNRKIEREEKWKRFIVQCKGKTKKSVLVTRQHLVKCAFKVADRYLAVQFSARCVNYLIQKCFIKKKEQQSWTW